MPRLPITDIQGLIPLIDPKRVEQPHIVDGANFYVDADGPVSGFARTVELEDAFAYPDGMQALRVQQSNDLFYFTNDGIYHYDSIAKQMTPIYPYPDVFDTYHPWSVAVVGGYEYYARRELGLLQRDPVTNVWKEVTGPAIPDGIVACTQSGGRLVLLAKGDLENGLVAWSAIDDGTDFVTSTVTGAGFQRLSMLALESIDQIYLVKEYELGFLVFTQQGVVRFELVNALIPFRWQVLSRRLRPVNAWCIVELADYETLILDRTGLFRTSGQEFELYSPLMSEHLHRNVLGNLDLALNTVVRLTADKDQGWLAIGLARTSLPTIYTQAYMLYLPSGDKWGSLNRSHKAIVLVHHDEGTGYFELGQVDPDGTMWEFTNGNRDQIPVWAPTGSRTDRQFPWVYDWRESAEVMPRQTDGIWRFTDVGHMTGFGPDAGRFANAGYWTNNQYANLGAQVDETGETDWDVNGGVDETGTPVQFIGAGKPLSLGVERGQIWRFPLQDGPLNSFITIGVFRGGVNAAIDELTLLNEVSISALEGQVGDEREDYIRDYLDQQLIVDWQSIAEGTEDEDWGEGATDYSRYDVEVAGTLDGFSVWQDQTQVPALELADGRYRIYSCQVTGLYHLVTIKALEVGQVYHIKTMELDIVPAGRLT